MGTPLLPTSVVSRKAHGTVGSFDVNLPLSGTAGVECRRGGTTNDYQMVLTFPRAVTFSGASLSSGTGSVASSSTSSDGKQVTVNLTGVVSGQTIVMTLGRVSDGAVSNNVAVGMGVLIADTNADGVVNSGDASQVAAQAGRALTAANFRTDVNADGSINSGDSFLARSKAGTALPASLPVTQTPPTMYLIYDAWNLVAEFDASGNQLAKYVHGAMIDEVLTRISGSGSRVYYHQDALGSTAKLTDAAGNAVEQYSYAAFGMPTIKTASGATVPTSAYGNRFMFTGREYLTTLKLYDYRNRIYSAELGRFLQTDPMRFDAGDVNLYRYVLNNPVNFTDPSGQDLEGFFLEKLINFLKAFGPKQLVLLGIASPKTLGGEPQPAGVWELQDQSTTTDEDGCCRKTCKYRRWAEGYRDNAREDFMSTDVSCDEECPSSPE